MNYKEKYEQAMLRMNKWVEGSEIIEPKEVAEFVFPELKESEDLKIKRDIQYAVRCAYGDNSNNTNSILAWLEKQGEHANFRNKIQIGDEVTRNEDGELVNLSQFKRMVKQREQKPIEWNADDLLKRNQIITILKEYNRTELIAWLEKRVGQKPTWSEEDENYCLDVNVAVDNYFDEGYAEELRDWLKSLKEIMKGE